jgi:hypothetical protein
MKLTVKEYSTAYNVSIQSVYKRIQRRTIQWVKENNKIYVITDDKEVENSTQPVQSTYCTELLDIIGRRDKELKRVNKEIKRLTKELSKAQLHSMATMKGYIDKLEIMQLSAPIVDSSDDIIDVKEKKSKKKDKKKKKGKKWK